ncbi:CpsD/CapB family tyrosine-protein kinase [Clostridium mediterraneense]|uniref:CpsD/CapB family tyrosine-protein kinase n=1 Tax=Clostridium mediterraneense TaxID=1805472 RepID=UPI000833705D|nr:CpsD/CapB family tyrosine-protein kinase [Clostridium mediterraneense]
MFIVKENPKSIGAEAYKILRTNIQYSSFDENTKVIMITSSQPEEGKSTIAGNLALSMAQDGKNTILIDCDLRKPTIHKKFNISNSSGLSEIIVGKAKLLTSIVEIDKNLTVITSGKTPPNPSEMLGSKNMQTLIEELREHYDCIIIDTPPILAVTDAQIISRNTDGIILVVRAGCTKKDNAIKAKKQIENVGGKIIGTVFNDVKRKYSKDKYYYYGEK